MTGRYFLTEQQEAIYRGSPRLTTPSKPAPWEGGYDPGERFSREQRHWITVYDLTLETVEAVDVEVAGDPRRIYVPLYPYFYRRVPCPVIGKHGSQLKVISPSGSLKLVYPDGSITRRRNGRA